MARGVVQWGWLEDLGGEGGWRPVHWARVRLGRV
jgi:hypothetical protein